MAAPNIVNVTTITGKTTVLAVTTSATAIVTNSGASGKVFKVNALYVSNVDGANNADVNVDIFRSSTAYHIAKTVSVPADSTLVVLDTPIYLMEGDILKGGANAASDLDLFVSFEVMDDA